MEDIGRSEDRSVVDANDVGATEFVVSGLGRRKDFGSTAVGGDVGDKGAIVEVVGGNFEAIVGSAADDRHRTFDDRYKGGRADRELGDSGRLDISRNRRAILRPVEMDDIGGNICRGEIIHAFVKPGVRSDFYPVGLRVEPEDIPSRAGNETEKNAFARIRAKFSTTTTGRTDPYATTEGPKV